MASGDQLHRTKPLVSAKSREPPHSSPRGHKGPLPPSPSSPAPTGLPASGLTSWLRLMPIGDSCGRSGGIRTPLPLLEKVSVREGIEGGPESVQVRSLYRLSRD